jgi:hypothetical protein
VNLIDIIRSENAGKCAGNRYMAVKPRSRVSNRLFFRLGVLGALSFSPNDNVTSSEDLLAGDLSPRQVAEFPELPIVVEDEEE